MIPSEYAVRTCFNISSRYQSGSSSLECASSCPFAIDMTIACLLWSIGLRNTDFRIKGDKSFIFLCSSKPRCIQPGKMPSFPGSFSFYPDMPETAFSFPVEFNGNTPVNESASSVKYIWFFPDPDNFTQSVHRSAFHECIKGKQVICFKVYLVSFISLDIPVNKLVCMPDSGGYILLPLNSNPVKFGNFRYRNPLIEFHLVLDGCKNAKFLIGDRTKYFRDIFKALIAIWYCWV